jgi:hypothetical protein
MFPMKKLLLFLTLITLASCQTSQKQENPDTISSKARIDLDAGVGADKVVDGYELNAHANPTIFGFMPYGSFQLGFKKVSNEPELQLPVVVVEEKSAK